MITAFTLLCTLEVTHAYYGGQSRDFGFIIPSDTARALGRGRMLARERDGRLHVLFEQGDGHAPLVDLSGTTLRFGVVLRNTGLANVTVPPVPAGTLPVYSNVTGGGAGAALAAPRAVTQLGAAFSEPLRRPERPVTLTLTGPRGQQVAADIVEEGDPRTAVPFDLSGREPGGYQLTVDYAGAAQEVRQLYVDHDLTALPLWAMVEITTTAAFHAAPPAFQLALAAREETLRYYVVARDHTDTEFAQLTVSDQGAADEGRPALAFERLEPAAFTPTELPPSLLGDGETRVVLFRSTAAVPRLARGRQRIQLSRNGEIVIPHLPQPGAERATADIIVHVSRRP